jgi:AraC family transcriptional regulator of adaptative response / DNA-3-methyladenine glycosylase II
MLPQTADPAACWLGLCARDTRFDGRIFVGVTSTGIYCRPICPARTPRRENCRFFATPAQAEHEGFRPCLRCRPELAPGESAVDAPARRARAAAAAIDDGALAAGGLGALARDLGIGERQLRRVFAAQFGVSPLAYAQTRRLLVAKQLLTDTALPVTDVALAAGFSSLRRFNASFLERYRIAPTALRGAAAAHGSRRDPAAAGLCLLLGYRPPLDWPALVGFLERRAVAGLEEVARGPAAGTLYRRVIRVPKPGGRGDSIGWIEVARVCAARTRIPRLALRIDPGLLGSIPAVIARVRRAFDLDCRPDAVAAALGPLAAGHEGVRLPGAFDGFELAVRAVLGQQVTVAHARALTERLVGTFGEPIETPWPGLRRAFPAASALAPNAPESIAALGVPGVRAAAVIALAREVAQGRLALGPEADVARTMARLQALPGIGEWTAQYVAMRALGWPDAFPAADVGVRRALGVRTAREALEASRAWRPWRGYAVMHLWRGLAAHTNGTTR